MKKLLLSIVICLGCGCVQVPSSRIQFGTAKAYLPKDLSAETLKITLHSGTNMMAFEAKNFSTKNNTAVINASTEQLTSVINATAEASGKLLGTAASNIK